MPFSAQVLSERWKLLGAAFLFLLMWALLINFASGCLKLGTECSANVHRSLEPLLGYLSTGELRHVSNLDDLYTAFPVGYSVVLYATGAYEGVRPFLPVLIIQGTLLFVSGLMICSITKAIWAPAAFLAFVLTIFNPNSIFVYFQPKEDGLFAFLVVGAMLAAFAYLKRPSWTAAIVCGAAMGIATNVRPTIYYLIFVLPVLALCFEFFADRAKNYCGAFVKGCVGAAVGFLLIFPWLSHVNSAGEGYGLTGYASKLAWASDFRAMLNDTKVRSLTVRQAMFGRYDDASRKAHLKSFRQERDKLLGDTVADWSDMSGSEKSKIRYEDMMSQFRHYSAKTYFIAALPNLRYFFLSGGEGEFFNAIGRHASMSRWKADNPRLFLLVKAVFIGFSLALIGFALLGIWYLLRNRRYNVLVLLLGVVFYFIVVHIYHGGPRYRVPIEPIFAILAACGLINMKDWIRAIVRRT